MLYFPLEGFSHLPFERVQHDDTNVCFVVIESKIGTPALLKDKKLDC